MRRRYKTAGRDHDRMCLGPPETLSCVFWGCRIWKTVYRVSRAYSVDLANSSSSRGGDIHICLDGNFHHRHRRSAGDTPSSYSPAVFISKKAVDDAGDHIVHARKRVVHRREHPSALETAVEECERVYVAADGSRSKANGTVFDDTGLMALVCRHDIPLFFANIDTPGEQQKFSVALISHLFSLLPSTATVAVLYDVACVLDKSTNMVRLTYWKDIC